MRVFSGQVEPVTNRVLQVARGIPRCAKGDEDPLDVFGKRHAEDTRAFAPWLQPLTLKLSKGLQKAGMTEAQADGITEALNDAQTDYVTKPDLTQALTALELAIEKLRGELQRFILVSIVLVAIAQILVIKVWH